MKSRGIGLLLFDMGYAIDHELLTMPILERLLGDGKGLWCGLNGFR